MNIRIDNFAGFAVFSLEYVLRSLIAFAAVERQTRMFQNGSKFSNNSSNFVIESFGSLSLMTSFFFLLIFNYS